MSRSPQYEDGRTIDRQRIWQDGWDYADCADMDGEPYDPQMEPGHLADAERETFIEGYEAWHSAKAPRP